MEKDIIQKITEEKIIAVTVFNSTDEVCPVMDALLEGGVKAVELALRTPCSLEAVRLAAAEYPEMLLGIGTVIEPQQVGQVKEGGAAFAVAPGLNRKVVETAREAGLPFFPGIATASEVETALEYGIRLLKFFPAEPVGGLDYLKSLNAPYAHLNLKYIPLGGVTQENLNAYLAEEIIGAVGGSWIASRKLVEAKDWSAIRRNAETAVRVKKEYN